MSGCQLKMISHKKRGSGGEEPLKGCEYIALAKLDDLSSTSQAMK